MLYDGVALAARAVRGSSPMLPQALSSTAEALSPTAVAVQPQAPPSRESVRLALLALDGYRGIRGSVKFGPRREPLEPKMMVYYALNKVNKKEMHWLEKNYGPPF